MPRSKKWVRRSVETLLIVVGLLLVVVFFAPKILKARLDQNIQEAHAVEMPLIYDDLHLPDVPPEKNAFEIYRVLAIERQQLLSHVYYGIPTGKPFVIPREKISQGLDLMFPFVKMLDRTSACSFPHEWTDFHKQPDYYDLSELADDLCEKADREDQAGHIDQVWSLMKYAERAANDLQTEPRFQSRIRELREREAIHSEYMTLALHHAKDRAVLDHLEQAVRAEAAWPDLSQTLGAEIVLGREMIPIRKHFTPDFLIWYQDPPPTSYLFAFRNNAFLSQLLDSDLISCWQPAWPELQREGKDWKAFRQTLTRVQGGTGGMMANSNTTLAWELWECSAAIPILQANRRILLTAIVLLKMDKLPATLPKELQEGDPVDGRPLAYKRTSTGFELRNPDGDENYESFVYSGEEGLSGFALRKTIPEPPWRHFSMHRIVPGATKGGSRRK